MNLFLISRTQSKLEETAKEIKALCSNLALKTLAFDFGSATLQSYESIKSALSNLEVGVLVNNVGVANVCPDYFLKYEGGDKFWKNMIDVNCFAATEMTYIVLPQMVQRHKGILINVSSAAGFLPMPFVTVYSATKTFLDFFTRGLISEYSDSGVIFQCVHPYFVATKMTEMKPSFFAPDPDHYANSALDTVGNESQTVGCLSHAIQNAVAQSLPACVVIPILKKLNLARREELLAKAKAKSQ